MKNISWQMAADRMVTGLGVQPGEAVLVREHCGRGDVLDEVLLALERAGAVPLLQYEPPAYLERLLAEASLEHLQSWDSGRRPALEQASRILTLTGGVAPDFGGAPPGAAAAWQAAYGRLGEIEEERRLPSLLAAIPAPAQAARLGMDLAGLEAALLPALCLEAARLNQEIEAVLERAGPGGELLLESGPGCRLRLARAGRAWLSDDGKIEAADRRAGAIVSNLPAGSIYTTVLESETSGDLWLAEAGPARAVTLHFEGGRVVSIAGPGAGELSAWLDGHSGEPRRVGHIGIGLNPLLKAPLGWTMVDEHVHGSLFICLGENRYMGGENISSLNVDYAIPAASLSLDGRVLVEKGRLRVT